ncbi:NAD(+) synthase [Microbacterium sp. EYE_5]|uniref:NAD(+) synthase n=1 Tax=unclassified Microbacterium TaxID=2609290 RepID=UPI002006A0DC|nr:MULTISPECIES: NAD(+) synthase [unclassified Microbacterium]MCK6080121.1 NAD(+) synthase [Microbacterium sp. EYE_382]MCK6085392.1 NAD(+) synthase [Microbacterium sp. EYE_384]MCK6122383.1 NAD(+) synthase [Microbacterium sp. EYE_80]MCK6126155.1 NAD(+) synthase [Microbacterium sp. EYE_79]MCK6141076.1 NAD(+) synthase [Microbacterium sp. EYE_39]
MTEDLPFENPYRHGYARVAACTIPVAIADPAANAATVIESARACHDEGIAVAVFPELCLSGYAIDDLVMQDAVLDAVLAAIDGVVAASVDLRPLLVVGAPLRIGSRLYNCAVVIHRGSVLGVAPKSYLPTYREFYEARWYARGTDAPDTVTLAGAEVPVGADLLFEATDVPGLVVHAEVCEDFWVPVPPSSSAALAGATVLLNLSSSPITIARAEDRRILTQSQSFRCLAAYVYAAAGQGESTNDVSWDGQTMVYENGSLLAETERFPDGPRRAVADVDLDRLRQDRLRQGTFDDARTTQWATGTRIPFTVDPDPALRGLVRPLDRFPFVPDDPARLDLDCYEAFNIQVSGLEQRLRAIGSPKPVIGVSGGLDSTHALLVVARAMDRMGRPRSDILAFTMPGFATGDRTKSNAIALAEAIGATIETIDIRPMATELLKGLGHPFATGEPVYDVTFENVQAGARTDFLFRLANQRGGVVIGTSDLSELALGWATYGVGDHMAHYGVNAGVPKTLIQHLIRWVIAHSDESGTTLTDRAKEVLQAVLDTEISPELVPPTADGKVQSTESTIGPYALHDFTLFHVLRYGFRPSKIAFLAEQAWGDKDAGTWPAGFPDDERYAYDRETIVRWLRVFLRRYFGFAQFKRSAVPNAPKVSPAGSLSPRGDWRAPSDGNAAVWLAELDAALPAHAG